MDELLQLSHEELVDKGNEACKVGNIDFFEKIVSLGLKDGFFITSDSYHNPYNLFDIACSNNQIDMLKYFLNSPHWSSPFNNFFILSENAREVCNGGSIDVIKYFLNEPNIKDRNQLYDFIIDSAADCGRLDIIQYMLENFSNNPTIKMNIANCNMLGNACDYGHLDIIKYFFSSEVSQNEYRDSLKEKLFKIAHKNNHVDIVQYLIMDLKLEQTKPIKDALDEKPNSEIERMFSIRDLNHSLQSELTDKLPISKKPKI
jgi:ankyrin repeat protein